MATHGVSSVNQTSSALPADRSVLAQGPQPPGCLEELNLDELVQHEGSHGDPVAEEVEARPLAERVLHRVALR